jgi:hypothetical protein
MLRIGFVGLIVALLLSLAACGPKIQPLIFNAAPWKPNESSTYQLTDMNGAYAGTARYDLTQLADKQWNLRREIDSLGTQEIIAVNMTEKGFQPTESTLIRMDKDGTEKVSAKYNGAEVQMELTTKQSVTTNQRVSIPSDAREQATLVMITRALPLAEGYAARMNVFLPIVGILDRVTLSVVGSEKVTTPAGDFDTWHVQMKTNDSQTEAWISKQAPFPVVKFIDSRNGGTFALSDFKPGQ